MTKSNFISTERSNLCLRIKQMWMKPSHRVGPEFECPNKAAHLLVASPDGSRWRQPQGRTRVAMREAVLHLDMRFSIEIHLYLDNNQYTSSTIWNIDRIAGGNMEHHKNCEKSWPIQIRVLFSSTVNEQFWCMRS